MSRSKSESLLGLTESFFHRYLQNTRGASAHTVRAYRDVLKLFYCSWRIRSTSPWLASPWKIFNPMPCSRF